MKSILVILLLMVNICSNAAGFGVIDHVSVYTLKVTMRQTPAGTQSEMRPNPSHVTSSETPTWDIIPNETGDYYYVVTIDAVEKKDGSSTTLPICCITAYSNIHDSPDVVSFHSIVNLSDYAGSQSGFYCEFYSDADNLFRVEVKEK